MRERLQRLQIDYDDSLDFATVVDLYRRRIHTINELVDNILYFFQDFADYDAKAAGKVLRAGALGPLQRLLSGLEALQTWTANDIHGVIETVTRDLDVGMGKVGQPLRVAVTGGSFSPPIDQTVELVGRQRSLARIERAIDHINMKQM